MRARRTTTVARLRPDEVAAVLAPRDGLVAEQPTGDATAEQTTGSPTFEQAEGPLAHYQRRLTIGPVGADGRSEVRQEVDLVVGLPGFSWLFALPVRRHLGRVGSLRRSPWWAPPARLPRPAAVTLAALCLLSVVVGYVTDLLADTMTYAAGDFRVGTTGQGVALGVVEAGAVLSLVVLHAADRRGRHPVLAVALAGACALSFLSAAAPSLAVLTALQLGSASLAGAAAVIIGVIAVEEMPAGSRAWALGVIGMAFGLGSGGTLAMLPLADVGPGGWRWPYAVAALGVPLAWRWARHVRPATRHVRPATRHVRPATRHVRPATRHVRPTADHLRPAARHVHPRPQATTAPITPTRPLPGLWRRRLLVLGAGALLLALFASPASDFQNHYLHVQRHLSATRISLLEQLSGTIGGLGTLVGGRLADTWGRRPVAALGVAAGTAITLAHYTSAGAAMWVWNTLGSLVSYAVAPALAVYGAELFPAPIRARAGGVLTVLAAGGGALGLVVAGAASSALGGTAPALAALALAPAALVVLILAAYPETARVPLDELHPGPVAAL